MKKILSTLSIAALSMFAFSQTEAPEYISSARPTATVGTYIMHPKVVNIEGGILFENVQNDLSINSLTPNVMIRVGVSKTTELYLIGSAQFEHQIKPNDQNHAQYTFPTIGTKTSIFRNEKLATTLDLNMSLYNSDHGVVSGNFRISTSYSFTPKSTVTMNIGKYYGANSAMLYTLNYNHQFTPKMGVFVEVFGSPSFDQELYSNSVAIGVLYRLSKNFQLDLSGGMRLQDDYVSNFRNMAYTKFGMAYRINK